MANPLTKNVLVLNKSYLAIKVIDVRTAICILYKNQAKIVDDYYRTYTLDEWKIQSLMLSINPAEFQKYKYIVSSPSVSIVIPKVIILNKDTKYIAELKTVRYSRKNILTRDEYTCQYCGHRKKDEMTLDHVIPRSKGGDNSFTNLVTCCKDCNLKKGNKTIKEVGMKLLKQPETPKWKSFIGKSFNQVMDKYWENFL
jgi:hypothetical protein